MAPARRNRRWLWFFVVVFVLAVAATVTLIRINMALQLKPEALDAAWALWKEKGPPSYVLVYTRSVPGSDTETYLVRVRDGKTVFASLNGMPLEDRLYPRYGMDALFGDLDDFLRLAHKPGAPRTYLVAGFDPEDGHIYRFVRSVSSVMGRTHERVEINVQELRPLGPGEADSKKEAGKAQAPTRSASLCRRARPVWRKPRTCLQKRPSSSARKTASAQVQCRRSWPASWRSTAIW